MARHELITRIEIAAPVERVWSILADFTEYPQWNPFIRSVSGIARRGERLRVSIQPKGRGAMTFRPQVLGATERQELRWLGSLGFRGLFDGEQIKYYLSKRNSYDDTVSDKISICGVILSVFLYIRSLGSQFLSYGV